MKTLGCLIILALEFSNCQPGATKIDTLSDNTNCIQTKIDQLKREEVRNPPAEVWKWEVDNKTFYYIASNCCDQYNYLYDEKCNVVCAPDGGFTGQGDGKCPKFNEQIKKTLVWKDNRTE